MKNVKIISIIIILMCLTSQIISQNRLLNKANKQYFLYDYYSAINYYEAVKNKTIEVKRILANSYEQTYQIDNAIVYYESVINDQMHDYNDIWNYFMILLKAEKYEKAMQLVDTLYQVMPKDSRVKSFYEDKDYYNSLINQEPNFEIRNLKLNTEQQDFGTVFYKDKIAFASTKRNNSFFRRVWNGNKLHFLNIYKADIDEDSELINIKPLYNKFNRKFHDGPVSFNSDGTLMALTRNNYKNKSADGTRNLQIFISEYIDNSWSELESFPYNNPEYSVGQASFTPDGKYMYFVSDMPGGKGGTDIYKIERRKDGTWGKLQNLESINTEGNEMFPYFHNSGLLFFSSDGHPGLGGLDIFMTSAIDGNYGMVKNLGKPINSSMDDFALCLDDSLSQGYFSSNRIDGKGNDDIYFAKALLPLKLEKRIKGITKDPENNIISSATVKLILNDEKIEEVISDEEGNFQFIVDKETVYNLKGLKTDYYDGHNTANTNVPDEIVYADLILKRIPQFSLKIIVLDKNDNTPIEGVKIALTDNLTFEEEIIYTSENGEYYTEMPDKNINDRISYNLRFEKKGYIPKTSTYYQIIDREGEFKILEKLDPSEYDLAVGDDLGAVLGINPIYFDLDRYNIRPDAAIELDKIVELMNKYTTMEIELGSHTDCRGSYEYNMRLSDRRARSSAEYIRQRITNPDRISGRGYGESRLVNDCACEGDVVSDCTEEEHQMNRRTEFIIINM